MTGLSLWQTGRESILSVATQVAMETAVLTVLTLNRKSIFLSAVLMQFEAKLIECCYFEVIVL